MHSDSFKQRHIGPRESDLQFMLAQIGTSGLDELIRKTIPGSILKDSLPDLPEGVSEYQFLKEIREIADKNKVFRSYIGLGFYNTILPPVIQRNILENPNWYTSYTPYQAEISQGRLEALLNFQTVVVELTGLEIANASLLDESTAAAEAMIMLFNSRSRDQIREGKNIFFADSSTFPQTLDVLRTRSVPLGIELVTGDFRTSALPANCFGALIQYPAADGEVRDYRAFVNAAHEKQVEVCVAADLLSLVLLTPPGEWGADVVVGTTQRFGIPLFFGGPHAGFLASTEKYKRQMPGRIIGITIDAEENPALRMALQTREQHIKRERATSNICTAQALLANMAGMYAVYHGPEGLKRIAGNIHSGACYLAEKLNELGCKPVHSAFFDTLLIKLPEGTGSESIREAALEKMVNFHYPDGQHVQLSVDETSGEEELNGIIGIFSLVLRKPVKTENELGTGNCLPDNLLRKSTFLEQEVFHKYRSETELMRYIRMLERKDFSLTHSMISLGSCTMKLNAVSQLIPVSWPEFADIHPFVPLNQAEGYHQLMNRLGKALCELTGFEEVSFQPNSGAAGEYAGLMVIRAYHEKRGELNRKIVLIPASAHGTNPASAVMAGMDVKVVNCDQNGNIDTQHLKQLAGESAPELAAAMITYPSTHGVFEEEIREIISIIHENGGLVYMDGANMNAQVGLTSPGYIGADVCHLNLHKTFAIPHGGGGPGVGPIAVARHLVEFLPTHPLVPTGGINGISAVSAAPYGSAGILPISWGYIRMLGAEGLTESTRYAILNANYLAASLKDDFAVLYKGKNGFVAHEMILDCRNFKAEADITEADIAKRLMDYGFHAPTLSFPVHGTLMVEPTESESRAELDRFIEALKDIRSTIRQISEGKLDRTDNVLKNAPHTAASVISDSWNHPYSRESAAFPLKWVKENKFWPTVRRVNDGYGDRNLVCTCAPVEAYRKD
ncbi:MAG: aminomethyl-transferring glycine dehydrogenase [Bacteroidota bacterium]